MPLCFGNWLPARQLLQHGVRPYPDLLVGVPTSLLKHRSQEAGIALCPILPNGLPLSVQKRSIELRLKCSTHSAVVKVGSCKAVSLFRSTSLTYLFPMNNICKSRDSIMFCFSKKDCAIHYIIGDRGSLSQRF